MHGSPVGETPIRPFLTLMCRSRDHSVGCCRWLLDDETNHECLLSRLPGMDHFSASCMMGMVRPRPVHMLPTLSQSLHAAAADTILTRETADGAEQLAAAVIHTRHHDSAAAC